MILSTEWPVAVFPDAGFSVGSVWRHLVPSALESAKETEGATIAELSRPRSGSEEAETEGDSEMETDTGDSESLLVKQEFAAEGPSAKRTRDDLVLGVSVLV